MKLGPVQIPSNKVVPLYYLLELVLASCPSDWIHLVNLSYLLASCSVLLQCFSTTSSAVASALVPVSYHCVAKHAVCQLWPILTAWRTQCHRPSRSRRTLAVAHARSVPAGRQISTKQRPQVVHTGRKLARQNYSKQSMTHGAFLVCQMIIVLVLCQPRILELSRWPCGQCLAKGR